MDVEQTSHGSFTAWGTGFTYEYDSSDCSLSIIRSERSKTLAHLSFDSALCKNPMGYVSLLEKATQIKALIFSNNQTIDLSETLDSFRLTPILKSAAILSRYAFDLDNARYHRFCRIFSEEYELKSVKLKRFTSDNEENTFFIARIQTQHDNSVSVRACTLAGLTAALSDRTLRDLITMEFGHRFEGSAHNLLKLSTRLSSLSCVLDDAFVPHEKIKQSNRIEDSLHTQN